VNSDGIRYLKMAAVEDNDTWFSIHHKINFTDGRPPIYPGHAHKKFREALENASYWAQRGHCVYLAQGMFRNAGPHTYGRYPSALRQVHNLIACKNLYMDIDVKPGAYETTADAVRAFRDFLREAVLPAPTIIVGSGNGGLHIYWTLSVAFEEREFRSMAGQLVAAGMQHGLKFDQQCTADAIRLLRVPGTWNFKGGPDVDGRPVILHYCGKEDIDIETMRKALARYKLTPQSNRLAVVRRINPAIVATTGPLADSLDDDFDDLIQGVGGFKPANIDEVAKACPFIRDTLANGGADLTNEPQWHLLTALACHSENPTETIHRLCRGSQWYNPDDVDDKLAVALRTREQRKEVGPPKCVRIQSNGVTQCNSCPHIHRGTTPLLVGLQQTNGHKYLSAQNSTDPNSIDLPKDYYRGIDDLIYYAPVDKGENIDALAFEYPIIPFSATIEAGVPFKFAFDTIQGEKQVSKRFSTNVFYHIAPFAEAFFAEAMPITGDIKLARTFMGHYLKLLQSKKETIIDLPAFGWSQDHMGDMGFAYAGKFISPNGEFKCSRPGDGVENYRAMGDPKVWRSLMDIILTDDRPDLAAMAAASFAAPLVGMSGQQGLLLGLVSSQSGIGKSTSMLAGQSVWSSPVVGGLSDTITYTFAKCATLRHLPLFYDEIKGEKQFKAMVELAFQLTGGHEKGRANRAGSMREVREFKTLCGYASNMSIVASVRDEDKGTDASWLRMFEMQGIIKPSGDDEFAANINLLMTGLSLNYGNVGIAYAQFLGRNHKLIEQKLAGFQTTIANDLGANVKTQRFWVAAMATVMLGAYLANVQGYCIFPLMAIRDYMYAEFRRMTQEMLDDPNDYGNEIALINSLSAFLNEKFPKNMVVLDKTWTQRCRAPKGYAKILNDKPDGAWGTIEVQVSGDPMIIRISDTALGQWCGRTQRPKAALTAAMERRLSARRSTGILGSGSPRAGVAENIWVIQVNGSILADMVEYEVHHKLLPP
jgi:Domain of unknown function (DUF927)